MSEIVPGQISWVYLTYAFAALGALALFFALPRGGVTMGRAGMILGAAALAGLLTILHKPLGPAGAQNVYFYLLAALTLFAAARVVTHARPVYAALYFIVVVLTTAALAIMAGAEFLGVALVIVYAGAILVTYVFVIMLARPADGDAADYDRDAREPGTAVLAGFVLSATLAGLIVSRRWSPVAGIEETAGNTVAIGRELLTRYAVSVELAGVLLLVAMVGALAVARKRLPADESRGAVAAPPADTGRTVKPF